MKILGPVCGAYVYVYCTSTKALRVPNHSRGANSDRETISMYARYERRLKPLTAFVLNSGEVYGKLTAPDNNKRRH